MSIFDGYLMVDWSANSTPKTGRDSIWAAWGLLDNAPPRTANLPTRKRAKEVVVSLLTEAMKRNLRVLVGFDFAYAYPKGFARWLKIEEEKDAWRRVWEMIVAEVHDDQNGIANANDRFDAAARINAKVGNSSFIGPFWACPTEGNDWIRPTKPSFGSLPADQRISERRCTDLQLQKDGNPTIQSAWKLFTSGSVGSQTLLGIPVLHALVGQFDEHSLVWPFETGFTESPSPTQGPFILHAEIWPGILERPTSRLDDEKFVCRDEAQVFALVNVLRRLDGDNRLGSLFKPSELSNPLDPQICSEEGWILGAGIQPALADEIAALAAESIRTYSPSKATW